MTQHSVLLTVELGESVGIFKVTPERILFR
jgi:hypothetical protein